MNLNHHPSAAVLTDYVSGALRPVSQTENRLKEAAKLGFTQAALPKGSKPGAAGGMKLREMADLTAFTGEMFGAG